MTCHDEDDNNKHDAENILITQTLHYGKISLPINLCFYSPFWNNPPREITIKFRTPTSAEISGESLQSLLNFRWGYIVNYGDVDIQEGTGRPKGRPVPEDTPLAPLRTPSVRNDDNDNKKKHNTHSMLFTTKVNYGQFSISINTCFYDYFWNTNPHEITIKLQTPTKTDTSEESFQSLCNRIWGYIIHCGDVDIREGIREKEGWKRNLGLIWKIMAIIMISFIYWLFLATVGTVYVQPPFDTAVLPVLDEYAHILIQEITIAREYVPMDGPSLHIHRQRVIIDKVCHEIRNKGGFWDEHHGLRLEPWEHMLYRKEYGIPPGATDIFDLCQNITWGLGDVETSFYMTMYSIAYGLPIASTGVFFDTVVYLARRFPKSDTCVGNGEGRSCDPLGTDWLVGFRSEILEDGLEARTRDIMKDMDDLVKDFKRVLENLDFLISIASHLQQTPSWFGLFRPKNPVVEQIQQIQQFQYNITQMLTKVSNFIDTQTNIIEQEASLAEWLSSLILWSQTHPSPYKIPSPSNANTIHTNPWAVWRPREENGNWCTVPRCPEPNADGDNVLVKLVPPSAEQAYGYTYEFMEFVSKVKRELAERISNWS
ncbi:hypothetical protein FAUST_293 [Fusarium austroamericanum]|uniref:Uncharacterized protein n=1 Tax=Fusarium austroamericanum TaxID=282268 RepID=A0AAN6CAN9_FUSAU|nr:hypothetical protein FAUST_293 [Fusarium austroamericanum]